jgi:hypothetical protein
VSGAHDISDQQIQELLHIDASFFNELSRDGFF